ncbi:DUF805 domain-containing protein [Salinibacterium sp. NSLL150]|uniref:DUF805 domain-containing protein n=1 Tax=unclassified Salinibacterium TaxID=2632331 RepID=UPI0018CEE5EE|nr:MULTISPECIES: DUF805 domain-containing protein [unclassified Salinibacterium]MBH0098332.1 DUF805 domain-containing protein [Salinibacterium sp. NSLL35]MBH0101087.1 DUF805 domain-containing protein [Salinibacterium sp. NSLL150]MBH0103846.1 DUF805 domain-containing protein [Salinibacterium sp. NSLL16]MBH0106607.1 DUF805 domain-containing protein [Salinibacterium sp. NSLL17]
MTFTATAAPTMEPASAPLLGASMRVAMRRFFDHSFRMRGRASRSEYWWWMLVNIAVVTALEVVAPLLIAGRPMVTELTVGPFGSLVYPTLSIASWSGATTATSPALVFLSFIAGGWVLLTAIPGIAIAVRRLHDSNLSGGWAFLALVPLGALIVLVLALRGSRPDGLRFD